MLGSDLGRARQRRASRQSPSRSHAPSLIVYVARDVCTSILGTVFRPAESALLPTLARTPEELAAANVSSSTFDSVGSFVGPAIAALLLSVSRPRLAFGLVAATFAWSALVRLARPRARRGPLRLGRERARAGLGAGVRAIRAEPRLRLLIGLYGAQCFVAGALGVLVIVIALDLLDIGNAGVGLLQAASGIGSIVGAGVALALVGRGAARRRLRARDRPLGRAARADRRRPVTARRRARARRRRRREHARRHLGDDAAAADGSARRSQRASSACSRA